MNKKCKNCGRVMKNVHPNKKFCSNKGRHNCKDAYHNRTNPRGIVGAMLSIKAAQRKHQSFEEEFEHGHIFASGWDGHGQE